MAIEWTTLDFIENAPRTVKIATFVIAILILAVLEARDWLRFKGPRYFPVSIVALLAIYFGVVSYAYFWPWSVPNSPAPYQYRNEMSLKTTFNVIQTLGRFFKQISPLTIVVTAPPDNAAYKEDFYELILAACRQSDVTCTIEPAPDTTVEVDSGIPDPQYPGVVIHHEPASNVDVMNNPFMISLGCFIVKKSSHIPAAIAALNDTHNKNFYWFELGHGSPWKPDGSCPGVR